MSTWEIELAAAFFGLIDGGTAGLVWGYFLCWIGYGLVFASISEMASMCVLCPTDLTRTDIKLLQLPHLRWAVSLGV